MKKNINFSIAIPNITGGTKISGTILRSGYSPPFSPKTIFLSQVSDFVEKFLKINIMF